MAVFLQNNLDLVIADVNNVVSVSRDISKVNNNLSNIEQVRKFILIDHEFTIENDMMTPTMKVKRYKIKSVFGDQLDNLY